MSEFISWSRLHLELVWVFGGPLAREHRNRAYDPGLPAAWLLDRGELRMTFGNDVHRVSAGEWVFPPLKQGWATFSDDVELLSVRFVACWPDGMMLFNPQQCHVVPSTARPELERSGRALARATQETMGNLHTNMRAGRTTLASHLQVKHLFLRWLADYAAVMQSLGVQPQSSRLTDTRIPEALAFIEDHFPGTVPEAAIARHVSLSVTQLNRLFVRHLGTSPKALIDRRRLQQAQQDLSYTRAPIKSIAYRLGFGSLPHFSRWFSKRTGRSPSAHRQLVLAGTS